MIKTRAFLKWAGSKFRCIDTILASLPEGNRLIEPFTGSGAVFMNSDYDQYLLAEGNSDLVLLFQQVQHKGLAFINYCSRLFVPKNNCEEQYYRLRDEFNTCKPSKRRAALFLYLNRHGYNGLCRYNQRGLYNVPYGRYIKPYFPRHEMLFFHQKSSKATFLHHDFRSTFALAKAGDIIYCDPPYVPLSASANFSSYTDKVFNQQDHIDLATLAIDSASRDIRVVISNHDTELTRHYYQQAEIISFPVNRYISCNGSKRLPVQELIAVFSN